MRAVDAGLVAGYLDSEARQPLDAKFPGWSFEVAQSQIDYNAGVIHRNDLAPSHRQTALADIRLQRRNHWARFLNNLALTIVGLFTFAGTLAVSTILGPGS